MSILAKIHVAKKQLGLDDDTYRDLLERETGKRSAAELNQGERQRIVKVFESMGFSKAKPRPVGLQGHYAKKLQALWIAAWNLGLVRDRRDGALTTFVRRQTGLDAVRFCHEPADAAKAIEALKGWLARDGGVDWTESRYRTPTQNAPGYRIARAQWAKLDPQNPGIFWDVVAKILDRPVTGAPVLKVQDWQAVMNAFGTRIRAQAK